MKPEEEVEIILWDWLKTKTISMKEIYFNRKNVLDIPIFYVKGIQEKPDLLFGIVGYYGDIEYSLIEVKDSSKSLNVLNGSKIIDIYFKNYIEGKTKYFVGDKEIKISNFLIATQSSLKGHLFKDEELINNLDDKENKSKYIVATKYKIIPMIEGNRTFEFVRTLWNQYSRIRKDYEGNDIGIGIIIGDIANKRNPSMMITTFNKKKKRWGQAFRRL